MTVERYAFTDCEATTAAGVPLRIPAGVHHVERRSLVFRVRLGGRELDLTLAGRTAAARRAVSGRSPSWSPIRRGRRHPSSVRRAPWRRQSGTSRPGTQIARSRRPRDLCRSSGPATRRRVLPATSMTRTSFRRLRAPYVPAVAA